MCVCVCVRERERATEREGEGGTERECILLRRSIQLQYLRRMFRKEIASQQCRAKEHCTEWRQKSEDKFNV